MPGNNNSNSEQYKLITLDNLDTYKNHIEEKNIQVTRAEYTDLPSTKLTDGKSYFITDEGVVIKNGTEYGGVSGGNTTYTLSAGTGDDANKIILTPSSGTPDKVTVPYATNSGTVNSHTVAKDVPSDAKFTDTTYSNATTAVSGLMSTSDKAKVDALGTASTKNVPTSGNASTSEVVMGNDTRLSDARPASDVLSWAKASTKPSYTANEVGLGNVSNDKQIKGLATGTTENHVVTFGTDGYTVKDSGFTIAKSVPSDAKFTDTTYSNATTAVAGLMSTDDKSKLNGIASGAEVNQNAFSNVKVGNTTVAADAKTDTLELVQGSNVTLTPDATNDKITISATDTTYSNATTAVAGLMSTTDKSKLDGIASGAEVNQNAFSNVKVGDTTVAADAKTDTLELVAGTNITLTPDATNDKVTITAKDTTYSANNGVGLSGTTFYNSGVRSIATGGTNGTINVNTNGSTANVAVKGLGSAAYTASTDYIASNLKGANNGVAELDSTGKVPSSQLPSFVDDVLEYNSSSDFPLTGESGKIYIAKDTNKTYRWSGSAYVEISESLALGETSSTAYRGDRGKTAYDHSQTTGNPHGTTKANVGLGNVANIDQSKAIKSITRSGTTFTATALDGTTSSFTQQDNNTTYGANNGVGLSGTTFYNTGVRAIAEGTTAGTINVNTNGSTADVAVKDAGKAIKSITRSGTTFTATAIDGSTTSFTQQDNNTTYTGANGISLSGTTFSNSGVRSVAAGGSNGTINVNTNGSTANVAVTGLKALAYKDSLGKSDVGLGSVANIDQSKAIKSITRSGTTFTATALDGTTTSFTQQDNNTTYSDATTAASGLMSASDKTKLNGIASGAEVNQNAFSNVVVGSTTIAADGKTDTLTLVAGSNVTLTPDATNDKITIAATDTNTWRGIQNNLTSDSTSDSLSAAQGKALANGSARDSTKLPLAGGTMTGNINFANGGTATRGITATIADSDAWRMVGGQTATNAGYLEIATADDNNEPIYVRQYQYGDGSTPFGSIKKEAVLLDGSGNTSFPGTVTASSFAGSIANATGLTKSQVTTALGYTPPTTDTNTTYSAGSNITQTGTVFSLTKANVTGALGYTPPTTDTNTTYSFTSGTNGFTVTPSGGTAQTVTVTPSITNNVTGSGTSGYIAKFNGGNTITNGPAIGSDTTKYLRNDGTWVKPPNDNTWTAMVGATSAANGSVGYVNAVPPKDGYNTKYLRADGTWTVPPNDNTTYSAGSNITQTGTVFSLTKANVTGALGYTPPTTNTTYSNVSTSVAGLAPKVTDTSKYLKGDGTWATPTNTTYSNVSTSVAGLAPKVTDTSKYLRGDGTWSTPTNTTYSNVSTSVAGLAPKVTDTSKFLKGDGTWATPTNTNTTYSFANGTNGFTVTPSGGSAQTVTVTPNDSTKLPLAGGTMTGQIKLASTGFRTSNDKGYSINEYGNFKTLADDASYYLGFDDYSGNHNVKLYWKSGNIETTGTVTATNGFVGNLTGNASSASLASTASLAKVELTNPTSQTTYYPVWVNNSGDGKQLRTNDGLRLLTLEGTAETEGTAIFGVGNPTATGTAGNKKGTLRIYSSNGKQSNIVSESSGAHRTIHLPDKSGTVAMTSDIPAVPAAASTAPPNITGTGSAAVGTSTKYAREDHVHRIAVGTGDNNGQIQIGGQNVDVRGLGSNAYTSTSYLPTGGGTMTGTLLGDTSIDIGSTTKYFRRLYVDSIQHCPNTDNFYIYSGNTSKPIGFNGTNTTDGGCPIYAKSYANYSSRKVKEKITPLTDDEAKKILDVEVVNFDYKESFGGQKDCKGVIAEDVNEIIPYAVEMNDDNECVPGVDYTKFIPYLIKMVQIQQNEINELKEYLEKKVK